MARKSSKITKKETESRVSIERIEKELSSNQSRLSLILGALIVLVVGILVFNFFNKGKSDLGPAQQTVQEQKQQDVSPEKLPGKYTVKEGDTLSSIAEKYYQDGYKYPEIVKANKLSDPNLISAGTILEIPKLVDTQAQTSPPSSPSASALPSSAEETLQAPADEKGAIIQTDEFGPKITGNTYTVQAGDWLSKISARVYGNLMSYEKIAKANNITNPDLIEVGQVLTIPR